MSEFIIQTCIKILVVVLIFSFLGGFATYIERKVLGYFQRRLGPSYVGPFGLLQFLADAIKLFTKEDVCPQGANRVIFMLAPVIAMAYCFFWQLVQQVSMLRCLRDFRQTLNSRFLVQRARAYNF